jgi:outer membrane protein assembly factor BamB
MLVTGEIFGLDRKTGAVVWSVPRDTASYLSVLSSPAVRDGIVYTGTGDDHLRALRASDGQPLWRTPVRAQFVDDLLITEKRIIGVDGPYLFVFERLTGKLLVRAEQPHPPKLGGVFPATPASVDGRIVAPVNGGVWAFQEP